MYLINNLINPQKIGIVIYGSLYHYPGILKHYLKKGCINGPKLKISICGCNPFKLNLTRVIDYKNGTDTDTIIRLFDESLGIEQIKRYIALREGNINYVTLYNNKNQELINLPEHLLDNKNIIIQKLKDVSDKNNIDYLFLTTYPAKIENIDEYLNENYKIKRTKDYLKKCDQKTITNIEKQIIQSF